MKNYFYILIGLTMTIVGCKKELIPELISTAGSEGIYINGMLESEPINLNSSGNYYMYSNFSFDSVKEVYIFTGELKERYCADCGTGITLKVTNYIKSPGGVINFDFDSVFNTNCIYWNDYTVDELGLAEIIIVKDNQPPLSSRSCFQPNTNRIEIKNVEYYKNNELGQKTVKITFEGKVLLSTPQGYKLFIFDGSFAFGYP